MSATIVIAGKWDGKDLERGAKQLDAMAKQAKYANNKVAGSFAAVGDKATAMGGKITAVGGALSKLSLPMLGAGAAGVKAFMVVDDALDTVAARSGVTGKALEALQGSFKTVAADATQPLEDVAETVAGLSTRLGLAGKPLENIASKMLVLARVTGTDTTTAMDALSKAAVSFNVSAEGMPHLMDVLLVASQKSGVSVDGLAESLAKTGPTLRTFGVGMDEAIGFAAAFGKAGLSPERMVMGLNTAFKNLSKAGVKDVGVGLQQVLHRIKAMKDPTEATAYAVKVFGNRAGVVLADSIRSGKVNVDDLAASLRGADGAVQRADDATLGLDERLAKLKNRLTLSGAALGEQLLPYIEKAARFVEVLVTKFEGLNGGTKKIIVAFGLFVGVLGPVLRMTGSAITSFGVLAKNAAGAAVKVGEFVQGLQGYAWTADGVASKTLKFGNAVRKLGTSIADGITWMAKQSVELVKQGALWVKDTAYKAKDLAVTVAKNAVEKASLVITKAVTAAQWAWNVAMTANPIGLVIAAVAAFIAILVILYKNSETVRNAMNAFAATITDAVQTAVQWVSEKFKAMVAFLQTIPSKLQQLGHDLMQGLIDGIKNLGSEVWNAITHPITGAVDWVKSKLGIHSPSTVTTAIGENVGQGFANGIASKTNAVKSAAKGVADAAVGEFNQSLANVDRYSVVSQLADKGLFAKGQPMGIDPKAMTDMVLGDKSAYTQVLTAVGTYMRAHNTYIDNAGTHVPVEYSNAQNLLDTLRSLMGATAAQGKQNDLVATAMGNAAGAAAGLDGTLDPLADTTSKAAAAFDKLKTKTEAAFDAIKSKAQEVRDFVKSLRDSIAGDNGIMSFSADSVIAPTASNLAANMRERIANIQKFGNALTQLKKMGLNKVSFMEIVNAGPEAGLQIAQALLAQGKSAITDVNSLETQLRGAAMNVAETAGQVNFGADYVTGKQNAAMQNTNITVSKDAVQITIEGNVDAATSKQVRTAVQQGLNDLLVQLRRQGVRVP